MKYNELLISAGWLMNGKCRCGGVLKETWKKGIETLIVLPTKKTFRKKYDNIWKSKPLSELESNL